MPNAFAFPEPIRENANRSPVTTTGGSGDWKIGIGDRAPDMAGNCGFLSPISGVSTAPQTHGNTGSFALTVKVSAFWQCGADAAVAANRSLRAEFPVSRE
jgi:hypothetical protein